MSRHHAASGHNAAAVPLRKFWAARLPVPCRKCGKPIQPGQPWDLAHIVPAEHGGQTTMTNTRPQHRRCNRSDGGKRGAQITNERRKQAARAQRGLRAW